MTSRLSPGPIRHVDCGGVFAAIRSDLWLCVACRREVTPDEARLADWQQRAPSNRPNHRPNHERSIR